MLKLEKSQCLNFIFQLNYTRYEKKVMIHNCLLHKHLQIKIATFFHEMYIYFFNLKYSKSKIKYKVSFFQNKYPIFDKKRRKLICTFHIFYGLVLKNHY